jgi:dTMP kinase
LTGFLICLTGVDGSGKSTHAKLLKTYLEQKGYKCSSVWAAYKPFLAYYFFGFTRILGYWKYTKKESYTDPLEFAPKLVAKKLAKIMRVMYFFDYQLKILIKIRVPLFLGKVVLCDRYLYDLLMELQLSDTLSKNFSRFLPRSLPKPLVVFLMVAPESVNQTRRGFSFDFFAKRKKILLEYADSFKFVVIDSSKELTDNQNSIRNEVLERISLC